MEEFKKLVEEWHEDTKFHSNMNIILQHKNVEIIEQILKDKFDEYVDWIKEDLKINPIGWFGILSNITDSQPVYFEHRGFVQEMIKDWIYYLEKEYPKKTIYRGKFELCNCGKKSVYFYAPATDKEYGNSYYCDDCVPRGCSCEHRYVDINAYHPPLDNPDIPEGVENIDWKWIEKDKIWCSIDEKGREHPCCEYWYDENGFEINENEI